MYVHVHVAQTGNENVSLKFHSDPLTLLIKTFESILIKYRLINKI